MTDTRAARAAYFLAAPLVCLIIFWRVLSTWFLNDDFAWLSLRLDLHRPSDIWGILFTPQAQGTVRFLSERLFFLVFSSVFGLHALPYRLWVLGTWFADLTLANLIGARITGSRAAGLLAALLWTTSLNVVTPLAWASAYNQVLCAFFIMAAFYARLRWIESRERKWMVVEWAAYLAGFGAQEVVVMYPVLAALHALCLARKRIWSTLPLFVPAAVFAIIHFFFIPKSEGPYALAIDHRLPATLWRYLIWTIGPSRLGNLVRHGRRPGLIATALIGAGVVAFILWKLRRRDLTVVFCCGWFVAALIPVLPLPDHVTDYYVTIPMLGFVWLYAWAVVTGWQAGGMFRAAAILLTTLYFVGSVTEVEAGTRWWHDRAVPVRNLILTMQDVEVAHPGTTFLLQGVNNELFQSALQDGPFRLVGAQRVYFVPGSEKGIEFRADLGGIASFLISPGQALDLLDHGQARVFDLSSGQPRDVTKAVETALRADPLARRREFVDVGDPVYAPLLGPTWYPAENGYRWMPKTAKVKLSGPTSPSQNLHITGFAHSSLLAAGPVTLRFSADGYQIGSAEVRKPDEQFALDFAIPAGLVDREWMEITIEVSRVLRRGGGDTRELGMVFGTFALK